MWYNWKDVPIKEYYTEEEGELAQKICAGKKVLEIGALHGRSTLCIADVAEMILTVDLFNNDCAGVNQNGEPEGLRYFIPFIEDRKNISYIAGNSKDVVPTLQDNFFDVAHIDGLHIEYMIRADIKNCYSKLKDDGVYMIHDYSDNLASWADVKRVVDEVFDVPENPIRVNILIVLPKSLIKKELLER